MDSLYDDLYGDFDLEAPEPQEPERDERAMTRVQCFTTMCPTRKMRILSEAALAREAPWHFEPFKAYHFISGGDVDALTYLRHILRQQRVEYVAMSTWCMSTKDAEEMAEWVRRGMIGRIDFYVGEIFKNGYRGCLDVLDGICKATGGRVARFRNHSKVMAVFGERYCCAIEGSANIDTNPRTEQCVITTDPTLALWYKKFFDGIQDFDGRYPDWRPYDFQRE